MWYRGAAPAVIAFGDSLRTTPFIVFGRRATSPAACGCVVITFDGARRLACPIEVAHTILDGADAIRPWFGVTAVGPRRLASTPIGGVSLDVVDERWDPSQHALEVRARRRRTIRPLPQSLLARWQTASSAPPSHSWPESRGARSTLAEPQHQLVGD